MIRKLLGGRTVKLILLFLGTVVFLSACSELSLFAILEGEEGGSFSIAEREVHLQASNEFTLTASGGVRPYSFRLDNGIGQIDSPTGRFVAPAMLNGAVDVTVTAVDYTGARATALFKLYDRFSAHPRSFEIAANGAGPQIINVSGGIGDYSVDLDAGGGSAGWAGSPEGTLEYSPPGTPGSYEIRVRDEIGNLITVRATVYSADELRISPSSKTVVLDPGDDEDLSFTISGGTSAYDSLTQQPAGFGSLNWTEGSDSFNFTVNATGSATISVTDADGNLAQATVVVVSEEPEPLFMSPSSVTLQAGGSANFHVSGGVPPYVFDHSPNAQSTLEQISTNVVRFTLSDSLPPPFRDRTWEITATDAAGESTSSNARTSTE